MSNLSDQLLLPIINEKKAPLCACGFCSLRVTWNKKKKKWNKYISYRYSKECRENRSKRMKESWQDADFRDNISKQAKEQMLEQWQDLVFRDNISKKRKEMWQDAGFRENQSKQRKEQMLEQWLDSVFRDKMSKQAKERWQDLEMQKKVYQHWGDPLTYQNPY